MNRLRPARRQLRSSSWSSGTRRRRSISRPRNPSDRSLENCIEIVEARQIKHVDRPVRRGRAPVDRGHRAAAPARAAGQGANCSVAARVGFTVDRNPEVNDASWTNADVLCNERKPNLRRIIDKVAARASELEYRQDSRPLFGPHQAGFVQGRAEGAETDDHNRDTDQLVGMNNAVGFISIAYFNLCAGVLGVSRKPEASGREYSSRSLRNPSGDFGRRGALMQFLHGVKLETDVFWLENPRQASVVHRSDRIAISATLDFAFGSRCNLASTHRGHDMSHRVGQVHRQGDRVCANSVRASRMAGAARSDVCPSASTSDFRTERRESWPPTR